MATPSDCESVEVESQSVTCTLSEGGPCSACKEREFTHRKIELLEAEIITLKAKYDGLASTINAIHDPFIHKLPPEIGSHIFCLSLPSLDYVDPKFCVMPTQWVAASLRLGAVCREWRQLAWATPALWQCVYLSINESTSCSLANSLPGLLREWLRRSGALPLTIVFHQFSPTEAYFEDDDDPRATIDTLEFATQSAIETLNSHSSHWRNLFLNLSPHIFKLLSGSVQPNQIFHLELAIDFSTPESLPEFKLESMFSPTRLVLSSFPLASINISWENITYASMRCLSDNEGSDFLRQAPKLDYYRGILLQASFSTNFELPILHPQLRSLSLQIQHISNFLDIINLPSLEELTLYLDDNEVLPMAAVLSFLKRSKCCLKMLHLKNLLLPSEDFSTLLQVVPSLKSLQMALSWNVESSTVLDEVLNPIFCSAPTILVEGATSKRLLPHLRVLDISPFPPALLGNIPQLYHQGHRQSLTFKIANRFLSFPIFDRADETLLQLSQLIDEGVDLKVIDKGGDVLKKFRRRNHKQGL